MKEIIKTVIHDFLTDPLYYMIMAFSWLLIGILMVRIIF